MRFYCIGTLELTKKKLWTKTCKKKSKLQVVPTQKMVFFLLIIP